MPPVAGNQPTIGILALQGCVEPHKPHLNALNANVVDVRKTADLDNLDGIILPGGESSTMLKLLNIFHMKDALANFLKEKPAWGICAGAILMAKTVKNPEQDSFGVVDIDICRNAYGRQLESQQVLVNDYLVSLIRAPQITRVANDIEIKAKHEGKPTWIQAGNKMVTTFHPELNLKAPSPMHKMFLKLT